jgi:hypothetical protein
VKHLWSITISAPIWLVSSLSVQGAEAMTLSAGRTHLRSGEVAEWTDFANQKPAGSRLDLRFTAQPNATETTLFIRQDDVRQDWFVELNGRRLGKLFLMEADLVHALAVPPGAIKTGENVLSIIPPRNNDDIVLHDIRLDPRPLAQALSEAALSVRVTDAANGRDIPCRLTIVNAQGSLTPLTALTNNPPLAVRPGVAYSGGWRAELGLLAGDYTVHASRGFEWSVATQRVSVAKGGTVKLALQLSRVVQTPGWVSCDTHTHTFTHSRHGDATIEERMLTLAGEGIELPIATDHNLHIDYAETAWRTGVSAWFTPVAGNEVTTPTGHFNIFPTDPNARVPDFKLTDWPRLMTALRGTPNVQVVILNHPRNVHSNFQPFAATNFNAVTGENLRGPAFSFDAMELMNSSAQQSDFMLVYRDWFALLNHGYRVTAVGSSDGHDVSRYIIGQGRTYIACGDNDPGRINVDVACSNLLAGRALVSMGLLADLTVDKRFRVGDTATDLGAILTVTTKVQAPPWAKATNVTLFANGTKLREQTLNGTDETVTWTLPRPAFDVHLVAIATGPGVTAPFWAIPRPYQPTSPHWEGRVIASTNPIWVDGDGDGQFTAARGYAQQVMKESGGNPAALIAALARFDEAVATQAASLSAAAGTRLDALQFAGQLKKAPPQVQSGVMAFAATQR